MATKTKIKNSVKNLFIKELTDKKEVERLERVKLNTNLKEAVIYTSKDQPQSKQFTDFLTNEGIKFIEKEQSEYVNEYNEFVATTNMGGFPSVIINNNFLVMRRDFQTPQQLVGAIQFLGNPEFKNTNSEKTVLEHLKTTNYNLLMRLNQLSQQIAPMITFIQKLEKQLSEEDDA